MAPMPAPLNLDNRNPQCDLDYVLHTARERKIELIANNFFNFGSKPPPRVNQRAGVP